MNLKDLINKKTITKLKIEYNEDTANIYVRPLVAGDKNELLKDISAIVSLKQKVDKAMESGVDFEPTGDDMAVTSTQRTRQAYFVMCTKDGKREYPSYQAMMNTIPADLMDVICEAIEKHLNKEAPHESADEIEKN